MRRAIIVTAATGVGLVALLGYKSGGAVSRSAVPVGGSSSFAAPATTTAPPTSVPPSRATGSTTSGPSTSAKSYTGADVQYNYGDLEVRVTISDGRITAITVPEESATDPRSTSINSQAIPILTQEAMAAQGLHFDVVSGATFTSDAFAQSMQSALNEAGK